MVRFLFGGIANLVVIEKMADGAFADQPAGRPRIRAGFKSEQWPTSSRNAGRFHDLASHVRKITSCLCQFLAAAEQERQPASIADEGGKEGLFPLWEHGRLINAGYCQERACQILG
jgi:hypothetical protein